MDIAVTISKSSVMPEVYKITGYTGVKAVQDADLDRISSTTDDSNVLDTYFNTACNALGDVLVGYVDNVSTVADGRQYTLSMPANWKAGLESSLGSSMSQYVVDHICLQWFNLSQKGEVEYYKAMLADATTTIRKYLCERSKPVRA